MDIEDALAALSKEGGRDAGAFSATLKHNSTGTISASFERVIIVQVNGGPEYVLNVPDKPGRFEQTFDISADIKSEGVNKATIVASAYDFSIAGGTIKSVSEVIIRNRRVTLFHEIYDSEMTWRKAEEKLSFYV